MKVDLSGLVVIVTGSSAGIGLGIAEVMAENGANVVITSRDAGRARDIAEQIIANTGAEAIGLPFDLEERPDASRLLDSVIDRWGRLDILVNNAISPNCRLPLVGASEDQLAAAFDANITNTVNLTRLAYPHLTHSKGNVINITSAVVNRHLTGLSVYAIIKGAIVQMTKALAADWAKDGVRVNAINPGFIRTEAFSSTGRSKQEVDDSYDYYRSYHPLGKIGEPREVGQLAAFLASSASSLTTGSIIDIDGGYSVQGLPLYQPK